VRKSLAIALATALLTLAAAAPAMAEGLKVGVVDIQYVVLKSKAGQAAKKKLKRIFDKKQKALDAEQKRLLDMKKKIENPSDMDTPERRKKMVVEYQQGVLKLQESFVKHQKELQQREAKLMQPIFGKLGKVLDEFAKANNYDLLLARSQDGVVFAKDSMDVTEQVLKKLDAK